MWLEQAALAGQGGGGGQLGGGQGVAPPQDGFERFWSKQEASLLTKLSSTWELSKIWKFKY